MIASKNKLAYVVIAIFFALHCMMIFLPSINLEFAFVDASRYFQTGNRQLIEQYFQVQANTLGLPFISWITSNFLPSVDMLVLIRLLSTFGIIFLGAGILNFCEFLKREDSTYLLVLILLNPLAWVYAARATADFLPMALGLFAISLVLTKNLNIFYFIGAGILLGIAAALKYHEIFLILILIPCLWNQQAHSLQLKPFFIVGFIASTILGLFLIVVYNNFGFWVAPPIYQSIHGLNIGNTINNFFLYIGFLILLCAPASLIILNLKSFFLRYKYHLIIGTGLVFIVGFLGFQDTGELNLGPLERFTNKNIMAGVFLVLSGFFLLPFMEKSKTRSENIFNALLAIAILIIIAAFSLTRPSQRYLLVVMPFFFFLIPHKVISNKKIFIISALTYVLINIYIAYSQWCTGTSAIRMVEALQGAGLMDASMPGVIQGHVGNKFKTDLQTPRKYIVILGDDPNAIIKVESGLSFAKKTLSLIEVNSSSK